MTFLGVLPYCLPFSSIIVQFEKIPAWIRTGPVSPMATTFVFFVIVYGVLNCPMKDLAEVWRWACAAWDEAAAAEAAAGWPTPVAIGALRGMTLIFGAIILQEAVRQIDWVAMKSFTMISWGLMTLQAGLRLVAPSMSFAGPLSELLRFPTLAMNSITTSIWWTLIYPIVLWLIPAENLPAFRKFNIGLLMMSVHVLNLPLTIADHTLSPRRLGPFDLWLSVAAGVSYLGLYYWQLDRFVL